MTTASVRAAARLGFLALSFVAAACNVDRATVSQPLGDISFGSRLVPEGRNIPNGEVSVTGSGHTYDTLEVDTVRVRATNRAIIIFGQSTITSMEYKLRLAGLDSLTSGVYQVWLANSSGTELTDLVKATGRIDVVVIDTTGIDEASGQPVTSTQTTTTNNASTFANGGGRTQVFLTLTEGAAAPHSIVLVSIEAGANATEPSSTRPIWVRLPVEETSVDFDIYPARAPTVLSPTDTISYDDIRTVTGPAAAINPDAELSSEIFGPNFFAVSFGHFDPDPAKDYIYTPVGRGVASFRNNVVMVEDSSLARPPIGYFYAAFLLKGDATGRPVADTFYLGALSAPYPRRDVSLMDADINLVDPVVTASPPAILAASSRVVADTTSLGGNQPFSGFSTIWVTLEAKAGGDPGVMSPSAILTAPIPSIVTTPPASP